MVCDPLLQEQTAIMLTSTLPFLCCPHILSLCCCGAGIVQIGGESVCPVDASGNFTADITDFAGQYVKAADKEIIAAIKGMGRLVDNQTFTHSYPFCWRSETPLIYRVSNQAII